MDGCNRYMLYAVFSYALALFNNAYDHKKRNRQHKVDSSRGGVADGGGNTYLRGCKCDRANIYIKKNTAVKSPCFFITD